MGFVDFDETHKLIVEHLRDRLKTAHELVSKIDQVALEKADEVDMEMYFSVKMSAECVIGCLTEILRQIEEREYLPEKEERN